MTYSMDLRRRVVAAMQAGQAISAVAWRFSVSRTTVRDWRDRAQRGDLSAGTPGPQGPTKLTEADLERIRRRVASEPGVTGGQLLDGLSVTVSAQTIYRPLKGLGLSLKKSR